MKDFVIIYEDGAALFTNGRDIREALGKAMHGCAVRIIMTDEAYRKLDDIQNAIRNANSKRVF